MIVDASHVMNKDSLNRETVVKLWIGRGRGRGRDHGGIEKMRLTEVQISFSQTQGVLEDLGEEAVVVDLMDVGMAGQSEEEEELSFLEKLIDSNQKTCLDMETISWYQNSAWYGYVSVSVSRF